MTKEVIVGITTHSCEILMLDCDIASILIFVWCKPVRFQLLPARSQHLLVMLIRKRIDGD